MQFAGIFYNPNFFDHWSIRSNVICSTNTNKSIWLDPNAYEGTHEPQITVSRILPAESASVTIIPSQSMAKKCPIAPPLELSRYGAIMALYKPPFSIPSMSVPMWNPTSEDLGNILNGGPAQLQCGCTLHIPDQVF